MKSERKIASSSGDKKSKSVLACLGLAHMGKALGWSLSGLFAGARSSLSFRQEIAGLILILAVLALTGQKAEHWLLCVGAWIPVMAMELFNTALEEALDLITLDYSPQVKAAKDMASAAVFLLMLVNGAVWLYVFGPQLWDWIRR